MAGNTTTTTEEDIFDNFDIAEILAFTYHGHGEEALQGLLNRLGLKAGYGMLMDAADKLDAADMGEGAEIIRKAAAELSDEGVGITDVLCDPVKGNVRARLASLYRNGQICLEDMIENGVAPDDIEYVTSSVRIVRRYRPTIQ
jgi:hypothetical protein